MAATAQTLRQRTLRLARRRGVLKAAEATAAGITRATLSRMVASGDLLRVGRGLYALASADLPSELGLVMAQQRIPGGVICLLSALQFHGLTTQLPHEVWIVIGAKTWRPKIDYPPVRLVFASHKTLRYGVERHRIAGQTIRVTSMSKTVADCFKYRSKVGLDVAIEALRDYRKKHGEIEALWKAAEVNRVARVMRPYLEALA